MLTFSHLHLTSFIRLIWTDAYCCWLELNPTLLVLRKKLDKYPHDSTWELLMNDEKSSVTGFVIRLLNNFEETSFTYRRPTWCLFFLPTVLQKKNIKHTYIMLLIYVFLICMLLPFWTPKYFCKYLCVALFFNYLHSSYCSRIFSFVWNSHR